MLNSFHHHQYNYILFARRFFPLRLDRFFFIFSSIKFCRLLETVFFLLLKRRHCITMPSMSVIAFHFVKRTKWMSMILVTKLNAISERKRLFFATFDRGTFFVVVVAFFVTNETIMKKIRFVYAFTFYASAPSFVSETECRTLWGLRMQKFRLKFTQRFH